MIEVFEAAKVLQVKGVKMLSLKLLVSQVQKVLMVHEVMMALMDNLVQLEEMVTLVLTVLLVPQAKMVA